jgi:hypothetical protein
MGYMKHKTIVVTHYKRNEIVDVYLMAMKLPLEISHLSDECTNGYISFCVFPDGSKEGWERSDEADGAMDFLVKYIKEKYEFMQWVEVVFGDEHGSPRITRSNDEDLW